MSAPSTLTPPSLGSGEAGRTGDDVRSDLHVRVEEAGGGLDIELRSKVGTLYGDDIRETIRKTMHRLGVISARVVVDDRGALPWVIQARVEAAARTAGLPRERASAPPTAVPGPRAPSPRDRLRRSRLYLPGNEPKFMLNAGLHEPDAVILDLEDSVHLAAKAAARTLVRNALLAHRFGSAERMVRINQLPLGLADLDEVVPAGPDLILVPKVETPEQVVEVAAHIARIRESRVDPAAPPIWLMPILESALGVENARAVAAAHETVVALTIGLEDYTADLGVTKTRSGRESLWARSRLVNAARAAGVQAIDSVYGDVADEEGLLAWGRASRAMGFVGMGCLHPRQIRTIHRAFAPTADEIEKALRIEEAFLDAETRGLGVVSLGSKMIDPPVVARARKVVELARRLRLLEETGEP